MACFKRLFRNNKHPISYDINIDSVPGKIVMNSDEVYKIDTIINNDAIPATYISHSDQNGKIDEIVKVDDVDETTLPVTISQTLKAPHSPRPEHKTFVINTKTLPTPPKTPHMKKKAPTFPSPDLSTNSTDTIRSNELSGNDEKSNRDMNGNIKTKNRNQPDYQEIKTKAQLHRPHTSQSPQPIKNIRANSTNTMDSSSLKSYSTDTSAIKKRKPKKLKTKSSEIEAYNKALNQDAPSPTRSPPRPKKSEKDSGIEFDANGELDPKPDDSTRRSELTQVPNAVNPPVEKNTRRGGAIADPIEQKSMKDIKIEFHEKDKESQKLIQKAIKKNDFLNNMMDSDRLRYVTKAMKLVELKQNSYIIEEGDIGSHIYVSASGSFQVLKDGKVVGSFGAGVVFGELAILYKAKRFASILATTDAKIWSLDRKVFQRIMVKTGQQEHEINMKFLQSVDILKGLTPEVFHKLAYLLKREFYATGTTIIRQGEPGDKFYIIRGGSVTITKKNKHGQEMVVSLRRRGEYFGEQALLNTDKRLATVTANDPGTECLTLDRSSFVNYLGTITELRKNPPTDPIFESKSPVEPVNPAYQHITLNSLVVIGTLGVGGFGRVELVQYDGSEKGKETFALKKLKKHEIVKQGQIDHAYSEKQIMAACDSPFIVKLYNTYRDKKYLYFLMEPCLGGDVWTVLQRNRYFDERTSKFVTACVVEAIDYLHTRHIIYRDLKPENLMLDSRGYVKLVDFGFAKRMSPSLKTWTFAGTPEYVAPEIILNTGHDRAVDYWALGVFIHEILLGKPPFRGHDHMKTYNLILRGIDSISMSSRIPKSAQQLICKLCRQNPTERLGYQKKGIAEIRKHPWFDSFEWNKLQNLTMPAPSAIKRPVESSTDLSNFEDYPRDSASPPDETSGWDEYF